MSCTSVQVA